MFKPWQLAAIDDAGYNGIRDEHIDRVAESLLGTGLIEIDRVHLIIIVTNAVLIPKILHKRI